MYVRFGWNIPQVIPSHICVWIILKYTLHRVWFEDVKWTELAHDRMMCFDF
jgi:hypothetical protein